ncbi:hypothetical protein NDU88_001029 [Pleurodeles waltl]|uniref:Uncharacterized protein n=1 Tax=Pleurodeles waltl TaxID=8319 RepID=A0AAV7TIX6_PLEWA|nr:hypothetical protein NDU88_001029 [Pleurodeles waltl]
MEEGTQCQTTCGGAVISRDYRRARSGREDAVRRSQTTCRGAGERERQGEGRSEWTGHALGRAWLHQVRSEPKTGTGNNGESGLQLHQEEEGAETV